MRDVFQALAKIELKVMSLETRLIAVEDRTNLIPRIYDMLDEIVKELLIHKHELTVIKKEVLVQ